MKTYFFQSLRDLVVGDVSKLFVKSSIDICKKKCVVIPIHQAQHWILVVLMNLGKVMSSNKNSYAKNATRIVIFDSMKKYSETRYIFKKLCKILNHEWVRSKRNKEFECVNPFQMDSIQVLFPQGKKFIELVYLFFIIYS